MNYPVISVRTRQCASAGKPVTPVQVPPAINRLVWDGGDGDDGDAMVLAPAAARDFAVFTARLRCSQHFGCRRVMKCVARKQNFAVQTRAYSLCANLQAKRTAYLIKENARQPLT